MRIVLKPKPGTQTTDPKPTDPETTEPEATEPEATEPKPTEPKPTTPSTNEGGGTIEQPGDIDVPLN